MHTHGFAGHRRRAFAVLLRSAAAVALLVAPAVAQVITRLDGSASTPPAAPLAEPAYWLRVHTDRVNLRTRPDTNSLAVSRVDKDSVLRAVGSEFGWHRVTPTPDVFCLISAEFVQQQTENLGLIKTSSGNLRVRAGSALRAVDPLRSEVLTLLAPGAPVRTLGREGEWMKIAPPEGVYFYVFGEYVERISADAADRLLLARGLSPTSSYPPIAAAGPAVAPSASTSLTAVGDAAPSIVPAPAAPAATQPAQAPGQALHTPAPAAGGGDERFRMIPLTQPGESPAFQPMSREEADATPASPTTLPAAPVATLPSAAKSPKPMVLMPAPSPAAGGPPELPEAPRATTRPAPAAMAPLDVRPPITAQPATPRGPETGASAADGREQRLAVGAARERREVLPDDPSRSGFDARGVLLPSFAVDVGDYGLRYKLQDPLTRKVSAYVEFPHDLGLDVRTAIGRYCGVRGERYRIPNVGVEIIRVTQITIVSAPAARPPLPARDER